MARALRILYPSAHYHVMSRGQNQQAIFLDNHDHRQFLQALEQAWKRWQVEISAYCLMTNHFHLCLKTPEANLPRVMRHIVGTYTQRFNRRHGRDGPLFRGRYKATVIEAERYLGEVVRYIHNNPVRAGIVTQPQDYTWSSHRNYLQAHNRPPWLSTSALEKCFKTPADFHSFVMEGTEDGGGEESLESLRWTVALGSADFLDTIRRKRPATTLEHPRRDRRYVRPSLEQVLETVRKVYRKSIQEIVTARRGQENEARKVALWMVREKCDYNHREIARIFGIGSERTVGWACNQLTAQTKQSPGLKHRVKMIESMLQKRFRN